MFFSRRLGQSQRWHLELRSVDPHWPCEGTQGTMKSVGYLLMAEIRLTTKDDDYPIIYRVSAPCQVVVWDFSYQQYWVPYHIPSNHLQLNPSTRTSPSKKPFNKTIEWNPNLQPFFPKTWEKRPWRFED